MPRTAGASGPHRWAILAEACSHEQASLRDVNYTEPIENARENMRLDWEKVKFLQPILSIIVLLHQRYSTKLLIRLLDMGNIRRVELLRPSGHNKRQIRCAPQEHAHHPVYKGRRRLRLIHPKQESNQP